MPVQLYSILHLVGAMCLFLGLGAALLPDTEGTAPFRRKALVFHGLGLFLLLVAGFGLLAKLKLGFPGWIVVKLVLWLLFGALPVLAKRGVLKPVPAWTVAILCGIVAAWLGTMKPF